MMLALATLLSLAAQEKIDNPQYDAWKACKPGSWVKHKMVMDAGGRMIETETTSTLVEINPDKAVIEMKTVMNMGGQKMEPPAQKKDVEAKMEKKEGTTFSEKVEEITVEGKAYKCRAYTFEQVEKGQAMKVTGWICADVPGGMVKSEIQSVQLPKPMQLTLVSFEKK